MNDRCKNGHPYPPHDGSGNRRCEVCREAARARNAETNRRKRLEFSGFNKVPAIGDEREQRLRAAAADWAYGDNNELRYG